MKQRPMELQAAKAALEGIHVLDLSGSIAGQFCCRMMADFGAEVILIEPPQGSAIRQMPPCDASGSFLFFHLNLGKQSVCLDPLAQDGKRRLVELAEQADVIVVGPDADRVALATANPNAIIALISDFGIDGPYPGWRGSEMIYQALSGMMYANGSPGREPLYGVGQRASIGAGVGAYITVLSALYARGDADRRGQQVSIDVAQNSSAMSMPTVLEYEYNRMAPARATYRSPFGVVRCRDAWVCFWLYNHAWQGLCEALGRPELAGDPRFVTPEARQDHWTELVQQIQAIVREQGADEVLQEFGQVKLVAARVYSPLELWNANPHLKARNFWESVETNSGARPVVGPEFRMSETPRQIRGPAPEPGAGDHGGSAFASRPRSSRATPRATVERGPLTGLRVLEFTTAWAGPMAGRILGFLGAEVIHVESANKLDLWRQHTVVFNARRYPDGVRGERPYNRNALFNSQNQNKKSLCIDVKRPKGKDALMRLAALSDVVLCNFTAGTLDRMGFGYAALQQVRSDIIVVDMPGFGNSGPLASAPANGFSMEMAAGMSAMIGYPGGPPMTTGPFYPDPIGGYNGAAAALTALLYRQSTGKGQYVEVPQVEASMQYVGDELLHAIATGIDPQPQGNRVRWAAPHDAYRAQGDDEWVAIAIESDDEWRRFCRIIGQAQLIEDPRYSEFSERHNNQDLLREQITAWTSQKPKFDIAEQLQQSGIRAAPVLNPKDILESPYMAARKAFVKLDHADAGTHLYQTLPFNLNLTPGAQRTAAPCLGADTETILSTILNYSAADLDALKRAGVISNIPAE
jgi:crotonobetainyl-CoA:carnitine CoA-transferase CaiB-like acyl-CoA transferase